MNIHVKPRMTAEEFVAWALEQAEGRYELHDGIVVRMASERARHAKVKHRVLREIERAVEASGLEADCYPDGMSVKTGANKVYEPDAQLRLGPPLDGDVTLILDPAVVVEVSSPSTRRTDILAKLPGYCSIASLHHVIIVDPESQAVDCHSRQPDGSFMVTNNRNGFGKIYPARTN